VISHLHRCIFIHIPKCAGTSIEDVLWPHERTEEELWGGFVDDYHNAYQTGGLQHLTAMLVRRIVGEDVFSSYYRFAVVRNPWDRAVSQFAFMQRRADLRTYARIEAATSFKDYLKAIRRRTHIQWAPQYTFLHDDDGTLLVDEVLRFEGLEEEIRAVFNRLGVSSALPHRNAGERAPAADYYDDETRELVAEMYARDVEAFGYAFPEDQNA
jgi:Sulfotransferase family